jgi:hypothetical protein
VALGEIPSGWEPVESAGDAYALRQRIPGVAVSPDGERAVVIPGGERVADVDLDSLRVSYYGLSERVSLSRQLIDWLEPAAEAKTVERPDRFARWVGEDHEAVTGTTREDFHASRAGLRLIDTRDWSVRTLATQAAAMVVVGDLVVAYAWASADDGHGMGLRVYGSEGEERFHLFEDQPVD